jgi:predicted metal-dependent HD superfamily phosphohydrolase
MIFKFDYLADFVDISPAGPGFGSDEKAKMGYIRLDFIMGMTEFLVDEFEVPASSARSIAYAVWARMTDMRLHYHTPWHVLSMLQLHEKILGEGAGDDYDLTPAERLAIWFHDSVYVPGAGEGENEYNSVIFMNAMMQPFIKDKDILARAGELIGETAYHLSNKEEVAEGEDDISWAVIMDLDLHNFGLEYEVFEKASACVGREYEGIYTEEEYKAGRKKFFESLLAKEFIYRTSFFRQRFAEKARENLTRAINPEPATSEHPHQP